MSALAKELESRKSEIKAALKVLFHANNNITAWDVPEVNNTEASKQLLDLMQEALSEIREEILAETDAA